jgi:hypothetical protein
VSPFLRVVVWVLGPAATGVAKPRVNDEVERLGRARRPFLRLRASLRDAMATVVWADRRLSGLSAFRVVARDEASNSQLVALPEIQGRSLAGVAHTATKARDLHPLGSCADDCGHLHAVHCAI